MKVFTKKILFLPLLIPFFNLGFILIDLSVYFSLLTSFPIVLLNIILGADIVVRPKSSERDRFNRVVVSVVFLLMPAWLVAPYLEGKHLASLMFGIDVRLLLTLAGIVLMLFGGGVLIAARLQLGVYGGPKIVLEQNHRLITSGLYRYVRHPMYCGFMILFIGYAASLNGLIVAVISFIGLFLIFRSRMELEERMMLERFGEEYLKYSERTHRFLPFVY